MLLEALGLFPTPQENINISQYKSVSSYNDVISQKQAFLTKIINRSMGKEK